MSWNAITLVHLQTTHQMYIYKQKILNVFTKNEMSYFLKTQTLVNKAIIGSSDKLCSISHVYFPSYQHFFSSVQSWRKCLFQTDKLTFPLQHWSFPWVPSLQQSVSTSPDSTVSGFSYRTNRRTYILRVLRHRVWTTADCILVEEFNYRTTSVDNFFVLCWYFKIYHIQKTLPIHWFCKRQITNRYVVILLINYWWLSTHPGVSLNLKKRHCSKHFHMQLRSVSLSALLVLTQCPT